MNLAVFLSLFSLLLHVIERLEGLEKTSLIDMFDDAVALQKMLTLYSTLTANTKQKLDEMIANNYALLTRFNALAARKKLEAQQLETLDILSENEIISKKLSITLHKELRRDDAV